MAGGGQQAQGGNSDNSLAPIWISVGIFIVLGFIWYFFKTEIIGFVFFIKAYEGWFISLVIPEAWSGSLQAALDYINQTGIHNYASVEIKDLYKISEIIGNYLRFPIIVIFIILALYLYFKTPVLHYKKTYTMKSLLKQEKEDWPQIVPITQLDLVKQDIHKGPWAMALQPLEFAKLNRLLIIEKKASETQSLQSKSTLIATINRDEARKVFALQVGPYWQSIDKLPIHARALFAVFAGRIAGERDAPLNMLMQIAKSTETGKLNFKGVDSLLKKYSDQKIIQRICSQHAFVLTVMASMIKEARQDGVVASADFLWLKPVDRRLWYMLNSIGRQTPFCEVAGPFSHWIAEKELGRRVNLPMVEEAVNGLEVAVKEILIKPDED
jgi:intracellular multiplication protein IcmP